MERKYLVLFAVVACVAMLTGALVTYSFSRTITLYGRIGVDLEAYSVHTQIRIYKDGELILDEYHAGVVTNIGDNFTLAAVFGDPDHDVADYMDNATYISIGDATGGHNVSSTVLDNEWNRTQGTVDTEIQSGLNVSCTLYPDNSGPYTADCIGLNWETGIGTDNCLWAYDTFTQVTGIDETFTINVDVKVTVAHT